ncbi:MAG: phytanoyl-CoA dioxygenase family protein [Myxococcales bacterium]|nr:phytanoyl-CoA dioxygenase family protein [Myxococcales bacterium]
MTDSAPFELTPAQLASFRTQGWLVLRGVIPPAQLAALQDWTAELEDWAELDGPGLHHFEETATGPRIARSEDFIPYHAGLKAFIAHGDILGWVGQLLGEPAVLYKEKINYKHAGGAGFAPHQDATAYRFVDFHISAMVPLDPATPENGGLYFAPGHARGKLPESRGVILPEVAETLAWEPASVLPGDVVLFGSYAPHKSGTNESAAARRAYYLTYNAASAGDLRDRYYADKKAEFDKSGGSFDGERARISVNDDFLGRPAERPRGLRALPLSRLTGLYAGPRAQAFYDEAITELEHAVRCAALARRDGADDATVAAALLHDVGHLIIGDYFPIEQTLPKDWKHENVGARYLARWFGPEVTEPVRLHVPAKRYLVARDSAYAASLSPSSLRSLGVQGGPMSDAECAAFESLTGFASAVAVRRWDDEGKDPAMVVPPFGDYHAMLEALIRTRS